MSQSSTLATTLQKHFIKIEGKVDEFIISDYMFPVLKYKKKTKQKQTCNLVEYMKIVLYLEIIFAERSFKTSDFIFSYLPLTNLNHLIQNTYIQSWYKKNLFF